jgi:hypothetical protein
MTVMWNVPSSLVETDICFRGAYFLYHHQPDDGGSKYL